MTSLLVFVLLVIIYRSPIFWVFPLLAVFFAEGLVRGIGSLVDAGVVVNGQTGGILLVLVFGAGTDYALLLTARYREELHRHEDKHAAMRVAVRQAGPGIVASAGTVVAGAALPLLRLGQLDGGARPGRRDGRAIAALSMLTALPALLLIGGRRAFWPFVPRHDRTEAADETTGSRASGAGSARGSSAGTVPSGSARPSVCLPSRSARSRSTRTSRRPTPSEARSKRSRASCSSSARSRPAQAPTTVP